MSDKKTDELPIDLKQELNLETGKLSWPELQHYFARGSVIVVSDGVDLVEVAYAVRADDKNYIETLMKRDKLVRAHDEHAIRWQDADPFFWSIVIAPWILVQEIK